MWTNTSWQRSSTSLLLRQPRRRNCMSAVSRGRISRANHSLRQARSWAHREDAEPRFRPCQVYRPFPRQPSAGPDVTLTSDNTNERSEFMWAGCAMLFHAHAKRAADRSAALWKGRFGVRPYQFLVRRMPNRRGSVTKTFVVSALSSELRKAPVMAVVSTTFLTYAIACQPS